MVQILTIFVVLFTPIPWLIIAIHLLVKSEKWNSIAPKIFLIIISLLVWGSLGYWLLPDSNFLFSNKFHSTILQIVGIVTLLVTTAIEFFTHKALGTNRIFGSSEFKQNQDKLITHGIYKYARHPRYIEHPLWALGLGLTFGYTNLIWFFLYLLIGFMLVAYFEEKELIKRYGEQYLVYKKKVPAFFVRAKNNIA